MLINPKMRDYLAKTCETKLRYYQQKTKEIINQFEQGEYHGNSESK